MYRIADKLSQTNGVSIFWATIIGIIAPVVSLLSMVSFFIIADFFSGLWASRRAGEKWTSQRFRESIDKMISYGLFLILAYIFDTVVMLHLQARFHFEPIDLIGISAAIVCLIEFYSILENFYKATKLPVFYILTQLTRKKLKDRTDVDIEDAEKAASNGKDK